MFFIDPAGLSDLLNLRYAEPAQPTFRQQLAMPACNLLYHVAASYHFQPGHFELVLPFIIDIVMSHEK